MRIWIAAFAYFSLSFSAIAADGNLSDSVPRYCVDFSSEACSRIKAVIESKIRPDYCVPGFALGDKGLTSEQMRICWAMPRPRSPEEERAFAEEERAFAENSARNAAQRKQEIADARAAVYEGWAGDRYIIRRITIGYFCGVIEKDYAIYIKQMTLMHMNDQLARAGGGVLGLVAEDAVYEAYRAAVVEVNNGACAAMSPGDRGRLRNFVNNILRSAS